MVWAAMTLAFFGFLRLGELTCNSKFSPEIHLASGDVRFFPHQGNPDFMKLSIKASKTDPFRSGHTITIGKTGLPLCPILAMQKYLQARDTSSGPLFIYFSGTPLTKTALVSETRAYCPGQVSILPITLGIVTELGLPQQQHQLGSPHG